MTGVSNLSKNSIHEMEFHFYGKIYNINQNSSGLIFVVRVLPLFGLFFIPLLWEDVNLIINSAIFGVLLLVAFLWHPPYNIYENCNPVGEITKRPRACYRINYKKAAYEIAEHAGNKVSVVKDGLQIALIRRESVAWNNENTYHVLCQNTCTEDELFFLFMICVFCDRIFFSDFDGIVIGPVASKNIVIKDRYGERAAWEPDR